MPLCVSCPHDVFLCKFQIAKLAGRQSDMGKVFNRGLQSRGNRKEDKASVFGRRKEREREKAENFRDLSTEALEMGILQSCNDFVMPFFAWPLQNGKTIPEIFSDFGVDVGLARFIFPNA